MTKKLYRSNSNVKVSGVCGGIGEYFGMDATVIRLLWVLATLWGGMILGIIAYVICVCIIPVDSGYVESSFKEKL